MKLLTVVGIAATITFSAPAAAQNLGVLGVTLEAPPGWSIFMHPDGATLSIVQDSMDVDRQEPGSPRIRVYAGEAPNTTSASPWRVSGDPFETQIAGIGAAVITVDAGTLRRRIVTLNASGGRAYQFHLEAPIRLWDAAAPAMERALMSATFSAPSPVQSSASTTTLPVIGSSAGQRAAGQPPANAAPSSFPVMGTPPPTGMPVPTPQFVPAPAVAAPVRLPAACDISGQWQMNTANIGSSIWTFTRRPDGYYAGQEQGQGGATGIATVAGTDFRLDWNTGAGGWAGYVSLALDPSCGGGNGRHVFERGRGGFENTSWRRLSAAAATGQPQSFPSGSASASLPASAGCDISGQWQMNTANIGTSTWTFTRLADGGYAGQEQGQGGATGTAVVVGNDFRLNWNTGAGGWAGYVTLTLNSSCTAGNGRHVFERGRGGFENTSWQRVGTKF